MGEDPSSCGLQDLIGGMPHQHVRVQCHVALLCLTSQAVKDARSHTSVMTTLEGRPKTNAEC